MKKRTSEGLADLCFMAILILMFAGMVFLALDSNNFMFNTVTLCIVSLIFLFTYFFTGLHNGIVLNIIFGLLFVAYSVIWSLQTGTFVGANRYFWIIWPFLMNMALAGFTWQKRSMEQEIKDLRRKLDKFVTIDEVTQMNNLLAFERDAAMYMNISRRYHMDLVLFLWSLEEQTAKRGTGRQDTAGLVTFISDSIKGSLRGEDLVYVVNTQPYIWGTLLFTNPEAVDLIQRRVDDSLAGAEFNGITMSRSVLIYDGTKRSPLSFLTEAKNGLSVRRRPGAEANVRSAVEKREGSDDFDIDIAETDDWDV